MLDLFRKLKPLYGKKIDRLWLEYQTSDMERRREIEGLLTLVAARRLGLAVGDERLVLDAPPAGVIGKGEFTIGCVSYPALAPYPFRVERHEFLRHVFILGPTGSGKSTLLLGLLLQVLSAGVPFMVFDFKRNYRCLLTEGDRLVVFTVGRTTAPLGINALRPPAGVEFSEWAEALSDIISTAYLLMQGARNVLKEALLAAEKAHGKAATVAHAHDLLADELEVTRAGSRRYGWLESATRSLEELSKGAFGAALNTPTGSNAEDLLRLPVVFELQGLGDDQKRFFCLFYLQVVLAVRKNGSETRERLQHLLVFDEAHNVFPRERPGEMSVPARLAREVREYGEAIVAATQQSDVSESLIANSGIKLILRCDYPRDVQFAAALLQVDGKWLPKLQLGTGIARLPLRYYQPFLFTFDEQPVKNLTVPDAAVRERWQTLALPAPVERRDVALSDREEALLRDIASQPISPITQRYERLGWNAKTGNSVKDLVIAKNLARFQLVSTPTARVKILSLTDAGVSYLEGLGVDLRRSRHGGAEHEYWKWTIKNRLERQGYRVEEEYPIGGGKSVDLRAERDGEVLWVEVETGRSDIAANIEKCRTLAGRVVFVFTDNNLREKCSASVPEAVLTSELHRV